MTRYYKYKLLCVGICLLVFLGCTITPEQQFSNSISSLNGEFEGSRETLKYGNARDKLKTTDWQPDGLLTNGVKLKIDIDGKTVKYLAEGREPNLAHMNVGEKAEEIAQRTYDDFGDLKDESPISAIPISFTVDERTSLKEKYKYAILNGDSLTLYTCKNLIQGVSDCGKDWPFRLKLTRVQS